MGQNPEELRAEIARTRAELGQDLDNLVEKVTPSKVVGRKVDATKEAVFGVKDKIMGSAGAAKESVMGAVGSATGHSGDSGGGTKDSVAGAVSSVGHSAGDAVASAGHAFHDALTTAKAKDAGNPLAAGVIAFGLGWLASSLMPASAVEQQGAAKLKDAVGEPVKQGLSQVASEMKDTLTPIAHDALSTVKDTATDAVSTVKDQAAQAGSDVKEQASASTGSVTDTAKDAVQDAKDQVAGQHDDGRPSATAGAADEALNDPFPQDPIPTTTYSDSSIGGRPPQ